MAGGASPASFNIRRSFPRSLAFMSSEDCQESGTVSGTGRCEKIDLAEISRFRV